MFSETESTASRKVAACEIIASIANVPPRVAPIARGVAAAKAERRESVSRMIRRRSSRNARRPESYSRGQIRHCMISCNTKKIKEIEFRPGKYEVLALQAARSKLPAAIGSSIVWSDFDEMSNVVRVGVDENESLLAAAGRVGAVGVDPDMIRVEHTSRPVQTQQLGANHRPTVGGVQLNNYDSTGTGSSIATCSLGFNARLSTDNSHEYFVTAAHCTSTRWAVDGTIAYQPTPSDGVPSYTPIGREVSDPALASIPGCDPGYVCRYSDAALFRYDSARFSNFAYIARDSSFSSNPAVSGSTFRVDSFHVVSDIPESYLLVADTVNHDTYMHKVGITTGWTWGPVLSTCMKMYVAGGELLCQYRVGARADYGDSGAPTFWWMCCNPNEAWLGGILHGAVTGYWYYFSSITGIKNDIANLVSY